MKRPSPQRARPDHFPAPIGGVNAVDPLSAMPGIDCVYAYNTIPAEKGLRARTGFQEWCTGLTGATDNTVRTMLSFTGSAKNGSADRLFGVTSTGIWDVTNSTDAPIQKTVFRLSLNDAGHGTSVVASTIAGRFLLYCDEENGLYVYTESTDTWAKVVGDATQLWAAQTAYFVGDVIVNGGKVYRCDTAGASANSGGPTGTGADIVDGTTRWDYVGAALSGVIGPSLADQHAGFACDPADFVHVTVWKSRVLFVERDTARAWYGDINAIYGTFTSFNFGAKMQKGGSLVGLWNWSINGGDGLDTHLVGISAAGDVVIYTGTDPSSAATFGLKGCWSVGGVVAGRRIATDSGGDLLILSSLGVVPLSRLVVGGETFDQSNYATRKIGPVFVRLATIYGSYRGWSMHIHPTDNALMVTVPVGNNDPTEQLAMSFATKGWFPWRDLPILSACVWNKELYFGTVDGKVCRQTGFVDNVRYGSPDSFDAVRWSVLPAFRHKVVNTQIQFARPVLLSETPAANVEATAKYDYDLTEPAVVAGNGGGGASAWDEALWDSAVWANEFGVTQPTGGAAGMGKAVSIALRGNAISRTTVVGVDVMMTSGGFL